MFAFEFASLTFNHFFRTSFLLSLFDSLFHNIANILLVSMTQDAVLNLVSLEVKLQSIHRDKNLQDIMIFMSPNFVTLHGFHSVTIFCFIWSLVPYILPNYFWMNLDLGSYYISWLFKKHIDFLYMCIYCIFVMNYKCLVRALSSNWHLFYALWLSRSNHILYNISDVLNLRLLIGISFYCLNSSIY